MISTPTSSQIWLRLRRHRNHLERLQSCMTKVTMVSTLLMGQRIIQLRYTYVLEARRCRRRDASADWTLDEPICEWHSAKFHYKLQYCYNVLLGLRILWWHTLSNRECGQFHPCLHENFEKFERISTPTGSWIRSRRRPHQLPVGVEIISNFSKFSCRQGWSCPHSRWDRVVCPIQLTTTCPGSLTNKRWEPNATRKFSTSLLKTGMRWPNRAAITYLRTSGWNNALQSQPTPDQLEYHRTCAYPKVQDPLWNDRIPYITILCPIESVDSSKYKTHYETTGYRTSLFSVPLRVWTVPSLCSWKFWKIQNNFDLDGQLMRPAARSNPTARRASKLSWIFQSFMNIGTELSTWDTVLKEWQNGGRGREHGSTSVGPTVDSYGTRPESQVIYLENNTRHPRPTVAFRCKATDDTLTQRIRTAVGKLSRTIAAGYNLSYTCTKNQNRILIRFVANGVRSNGWNLLPHHDSYGAPTVVPYSAREWDSNQWPLGH